MQVHRTWKALPARTRLLGAVAAVAVSFALIYHLAISPLRSATANGRGRIAEIDRRLAALNSMTDSAGVSHPMAYKRLGPLSAAPIVEALTDIAHANDIRKIRFKTDPVKAVKQGRPEEGGGSALARMPVRVDLETEAINFAAYLDSLAALEFPLLIDHFEMRPNPEPGGAFHIRLDLDVYGRNG